MFSHQRLKVYDKTLRAAASESGLNQWRSELCPKLDPKLSKPGHSFDEAKFGTKCGTKLPVQQALLESACRFGILPHPVAFVALPGSAILEFLERRLAVVVGAVGTH
jgi:hypothetical protein